jgi:hypothetical protein
MMPGTIVAAARRDNAVVVRYAGALVAACLIVGIVHYRYLYNLIAGPIPLVAALANDPGEREFVHIEGTVTATGVVEETVTKHFHILVTHREETAEYMVTELDGRPLIVKVPVEFSGTAIEGKLVPLIPELARLVASTPAPYPNLLDATEPYRRPSWWLIVAALVLIPALLWLRGALRRTRGGIERHPEIVALAKLGPPHQLIEQIERDMTAAGHVAQVGKLWITPSWLVSFDTLILCRAQDVIGVGVELVNKDASNRTLKYVVKVWRRDTWYAATSMVDAPTARATMRRVVECMPWAVVDDAPGFGRRWKADQAGEERAADTRRSSA